MTIDLDFYVLLLRLHARLFEKPDRSIKRIIILVLKSDLRNLIISDFEEKLVVIADKSISEKINLKEVLIAIGEENLLQK